MSGLLTIHLLEGDFYLLAGILAFAVRICPTSPSYRDCVLTYGYQSGASAMSQVMQVVESAVVTIILGFATKPHLLQEHHPRLYSYFEQISGGCKVGDEHTSPV